MILVRFITTVFITGMISGITLFSSVRLFAQDGSQLQPFAGLTEWQQDHNERMTWWREARIGMFIHWGLYSPAGGTWDGKEYKQHYAEWIQAWAGVHPTEYARQMKPLFQPKPGFAREWARLAKKAGMQYAILTTKHHEGFTLFNSRAPYSLRNDLTGSTNISPKNRDCVREYVDAFHNENIRIGFYYSLLDWQHPHAYPLARPGYPREKYEVDHQEYIDYINEHTRELMTLYGRIDVFWPDYSSAQFQGAAWDTRQILQTCRTHQPHIVVNNRFWNGIENKKGDFATPEKYVPPTGIPGWDWEVCHTMNESFGYSIHDNRWKTTAQMLHLIIDTVSKGGNFLMNVGPMANGEIPLEAIELLEGVGGWLTRHGDAIYGTQASPFSELPFNGRCTRKALEDGNTRLYLHLFDWPKSKKIQFDNLLNAVLKAQVLNDHSHLKLHQENEITTIVLPQNAPDEIASVIMLDIVGAPQIEESSYPTQKPDREIILKASDGIIRGKTLRVENGTNLGWWSDVNDTVFFPFLIKRPGEVKHTGGTVEQLPGHYHLEIEYACNPGCGGSLELRVADKKFVIEVEPTRSWTDYRWLTVGEVTLTRPGHDFVYMTPLTIKSDGLMNLREIRLRPRK